MKICPTCQKTYSDETLNFCLEDGAVLNSMTNDDNSQPTIFMGQPPPTHPNTSSITPTIATNLPPTIATNLPPATKGLSNTIPQRPQKKSKAWIWVLGIVGLIIVIGGIGLVGIIALIASNVDEIDNSNSIGKKGEYSPTPIVFKNIKNDDFSTWRVEKNQFGSTELRGGEYIMSSKQVNYYYVLVTADTKFDTFDASTKITVRNVNGTATNSGYGILIHSDDKSPLVRDYGFLIDSAKQSYRVVQHTNKQEKTLVQWTRFPPIRSGTQTNELEIKDQSGKMSFYVNGQFAISVDDTTDYKNGVFGLYVSDAIPIAFSNLQIGK